MARLSEREEFKGKGMGKKKAGNTTVVNRRTEKNFMGMQTRRREKEKKDMKVGMQKLDEI